MAVIDLCSELSLAGIDRKTVGREQEPRINLGTVYTELFTTGGEERAMLKVEGQQREEVLAGQDREQRLSALEQLHAHERLVLLGDPGSGKSTFVKFVAMCLAEERLTSSQEGKQEPTGLDRLRAVVVGEADEEKSPKELPDWSFKQLLPVRIILRDFAARGLPDAEEETADHEHVWAFLTRELQDADLSPEIAPRLRSVLEREGGLLLFDGLDEVPQAHKRREQIRSVVTACRKHFRRCRVVVTSRTYAYQNQGWTLEQFYVTKLTDFTDAQIAYFVKHWYKARGGLTAHSPG